MEWCGDNDIHPLRCQMKNPNRTNRPWFLRELDENKLDLGDGLFDRNMLVFNRFPRYISRRKSCCNSRTRGRFKQRFFDSGQLF